MHSPNSSSRCDHMPDIHGNIRFDAKVHDWFASLLRCADHDVSAMAELIGNLYPNPDHNAADRVRRAVRGTAVRLAEVRRAIETLSVEETGSRGAYTGKPDTDAPFGVDGCTCRAWTRQGGTPRYCVPGDPVSIVGGWSTGDDCPHHAPVTERHGAVPPGTGSDRPDATVLLAARHLDATEGPVRVGTVIDGTTRAALDHVLAYVSRMHNAREGGS